MTIRILVANWRRMLCISLTGLALLAQMVPLRAGDATLGGMRLHCHAAQVVVSNQVPGPGFAVPGLIMFGPKYLKAYPPIVQRLIFLHECGHQYVGTDENAADCYAVAAGKRQGWLTQSGLRQACKAIWHTSADGAHLAGPERCAALRQCFDTSPGKTR